MHIGNSKSINPSPCLAFILTSMGGLCSEGHEFIRVCRKRNKAQADLMVDVLITQHSKWTARRIRRALFGQSLIDFSGDFWTCVSKQSTKSRVSNRCKDKTQRHLLSRFTRQFESQERSQHSVDVSNEEEWSRSSDSGAGDACINDATPNLPASSHSHAKSTSLRAQEDFSQDADFSQEAESVVQCPQDAHHISTF